MYSETHVGYTVTSLSRARYFGRLAEQPYNFLWKKPSLIRSPVDTANK